MGKTFLLCSSIHREVSLIFADNGDENSAAANPIKLLVVLVWRLQVPDPIGLRRSYGAALYSLL